MISAVLAASDMSITTLLPRMFISMIVVIGLMWLAARVMKNRQVPGSGVLRQSAAAKSAPALQVIAKQGTGGKTSVAIVRAGDKQLVLGLTEHNVSLLAELDSIDLSALTNSSNQNAKALRIAGDEEPRQSKRQGTGVSGIAAPAAASISARKGLLESVRELTVRR